jgi:hypothetical protein
MPATLEAPIGSETLGGDVTLPAETIAEIDAAFAPAADAPADVSPVETPATPAVETPVTETAPESSETHSSATVPSTPTNEPAPLPTAWQPGDDERQLAQSMGWHEAVVRGFPSAEAFYRAAATQQAHQRQQAQAASQATQQAQPDPIQAFLDDPLQDESVKAVVRMQHEQLTQMRQQLGQQGQGFQQHQQALQQAEAQRQIQQFHSAVDEHYSDFFGKVADTDQGKQTRRQELMQAFSELAQVGRVKDFSRSAIAKAFALAFPEESQQQTLRSLKETARRQADANLGTVPRSGPRGSAVETLEVSSDPGMKAVVAPFGLPLD